MTQVAETVLKSLLELSDDEQAEVMERFYESLDSDERGWNALITERLAAVDRGDFVSGTPDEIIDGIRRELHLDRESR
ncbi:MAG: hypothetical protein IAG10_33110 [Planctomycetaceae bacterium]|nr:hypothetical protein [Planctomycetaceae bacterium]